MGEASKRVWAEIEKAKTRLNVVYQDALILFVAEMQKPVDQGGNMPVKSGFLQSSLEVSMGGGVTPLRRNPGGTFSYDPGPINIQLRTATIRKSKATFTYAAEYAIHVNHDRQFIRLAVQRWPEFVAIAAAKVRNT